MLNIINYFAHFGFYFSCIQLFLFCIAILKHNVNQIESDFCKLACILFLLPLFTSSFLENVWKNNKLWSLVNANPPGLKGCPGRLRFWQTPWVIKYFALSTLIVITAALHRLRGHFCEKSALQTIQGLVQSQLLFLAIFRSLSVYGSTS